MSHTSTTSAAAAKPTAAPGADVVAARSRSGSRRGAWRAGSIAVAACLLLLSFGAPAAFAGKAVDAFFPEDGAAGTLGGQLDAPRGVAVNHGSGDVYVADANNHRVQRFSSAGVFERAWGWDVVANDSQTVFEICTVAADCKAGDPGSASDGQAGRLGSPQGLAIDQSDGSVYVYDRDKKRVQKFTADGDFVLTFGDQVNQTGGGDVCTAASGDACTVGVGGFGAAQIGPAGSTDFAPNLEVDPGRAHDVFVADPSNRRMQQFQADGDFVRAWGWGVDTGANRFEICTAASACQPASSDTAQPANGKFHSGAGAVTGTSYPAKVAIDSRGIVYTDNLEPFGFGGSQFRVERFDSTVAGDDDGPGSAAAALVLAPMPTKTEQTFGQRFTGLEVDPDSDAAGPDVDRLYEAVSFYPAIREYDLSTSPATLLDATHGEGSGLSPNELAVNPALGAGGTLYLSSESLGANRVYGLDADGADGTPVATIAPPTGVTDHEADLSATVDPDGFSTSARFQLSEDGVEWTDAGPLHEVGGGTAPQPIESHATGLDAGTAYRVRVLMTRAFGNGTFVSAEESFVTEVLTPDVATFAPASRGATTATLAGNVNPNGSATTYRFEIGTTMSYGTAVPVPDATAGDGGDALDVSQPISGLQPDTTYHYRLIATNAVGSSAGDDVQFTTRSAQAGPPGRAYELVSPAEKIGGAGVGRYYPGDYAAAPIGMSSTDGERFAAYGQNGSMLLDGDFAFANDWAFAERIDDETGWVSHSPFTRPSYSPPGTRFANIMAASDDLSLLVWSSNGFAHNSFFPEQEAYPLNWALPTLGDWQGRYEVLAPTADAQGNPGDLATAISADGTHALLTTEVADPSPDPNAGAAGFAGGLAGPTDPYRADTGEWLSGSATYVHSVPSGPSDAFPGVGVRSPVGVCDAGTRIPARVEGPSGVFKLAAQACPDPEPGRSGALVSKHGAVARQALGGSRNVISSNGSRVFFMSPDPSVDPTDTGCDTTATGADSVCPAQLYVRHEGPDGNVSTRWISRSQVPDQDAALVSKALFEGATPDGDKVLFRSKSPLTVDDPNGGLTDAASSSSWDLFMYDFTDSPGDDPGVGTLTRVSAGPTGAADSNVVPGDGAASRGAGAALRFVSDDGRRVYFTASAPLPGVTGSPDGGATTAGGAVAATATTNLYLYDSTQAPGDRYRFIALLPRESTLGSCATTGDRPGQPLGANQTIPRFSASQLTNCVRGTADGSFLTFFTDGRLAGSDPDDSSGDIYAYDVVAGELTRITASRGGSGRYLCDAGGVQCHGDPGFSAEDEIEFPTVVRSPASPGERIAYFQSKAGLVPEDDDGEYDVYEWRNGELSLLSVGTSSGAFYVGNSDDGQDVFVATRDALTWQDRDRVMDVYDLRAGGGIPEPPAPPAACAVLGDACQSPTPTPTPPAVNRTDVGAPAGDAAPRPARGRFRLAPLSKSQLARLAGGRKTQLRVRVDRRGRVVVSGRARVGRRTRVVISGARTARRAGTALVPIELAAAARRQLAAKGRLAMVLRVRFSAAPRAVTSRITIRSKRPAAPSRKTGRTS